MVSYEELLILYNDLPFSLNSVITEWIQSGKTTINKALYGKYNGHYNLKHSNEAKKKIGEHTKKLWASDSSAKRRMIEGLRKSGSVQKGKFKKPREKRVCNECGKIFEVIITSPQKFCSQSCSGNVAIRKATDSYVNRRHQIHIEIKEFIVKWSIENKDKVLAAPFNKIKTTIKPLIDSIQIHYDVKDFRVISKAVFGEDRGRKELLRFMKNVCNEKVC